LNIYNWLADRAEKPGAGAEMEYLAKIRKLSLMKTIYYNLKFGMQDMPLLIAKGSIVKLCKNSRIAITNGRVEFGLDFLNRGKTSLKMGKEAELTFHGPACICNGCRITIEDGGKLVLGSNVFINESSRITACSEIRIGDGCWIGWDVNIIDTDFHRIAGNKELKPFVSGIRIEDHVWVGAKAMILKGVTVGSGSVIAGGAIVTKDVPPRCLAAGNPARIIKEDIEWEI
jgi:acetyltransferase-like isoleucine patch superfamily enzyme